MGRLISPRYGMCLHVTAAALLLTARLAPADEITFLGFDSISGTARDFSGLTGNISSNAGTKTAIPNNTFGSAGSAIDYTGIDNLYLMASDRGPSDGDARYADRVHRVRITISLGSPQPVHAQLVGTTLLTSPTGKGYTGASGAFVGSPGYAQTESLRLDPEGLRCLPDGTFWLSDEYGPFVLHFDAAGKCMDAFPVPAKYTISKLSAEAEVEIASNKTGRETNRGMEGLALSPDGKTLIGLMQSALLQDHLLDADKTRVATFNRILVMNLAERTTREYVYPLDSAKFGCNEMLAINDHEFLAIERDGKPGGQAKAKNIFRIDFAGATDISKPFSAGGRTYDYTGTTAENGLPASGPIPGVTPVKKSAYIDLLNPAWHLAGEAFPEKIEGLAWGPDFLNGDKLLIVTSDNDFVPENPTCFYAFRIHRQ